MSVPFVGQRILFSSLMCSKAQFGEIIEVGRRDAYSGQLLCRVKLDSQDKPIGSVLYYDERPFVVKSNIGQICWPAPKRIQRKRVKGYRMPPGAVYVGRPSKRGNPFPVQKYGRIEAISLYKKWLRGELSDWEIEEYCPEARQAPPESSEELRGKDLACWCRLCDKHKDGKPLGVECPDCDPCHADVLLETANS